MNTQERKKVGFRIIVTENVASVTQGGPYHLWDLRYCKIKNKANKTFKWSLEPSRGMQTAPRNPDVLWSTEE